VSIKGGDYRWLKQALERGDLPLVKATAAQLPRLNLEDALAIALLIIEHEPQNAERAAVRWIGRLCLERREVTLALVRAAVDAFAPIVDDPDAAEGVLRRIAEEAR
jgi:ribosomal 50S subunit-associated protein YjgA (DUF615 family)